MKKRTRKNPVPALRVTRTAAQLKAAGRLYQDFTGHAPKVVARIAKPRYPDAVTVIGECDGVLYTTVRDGQKEKYIHRFKASSRPLLCTSPDGNTLYLLGGAFSFTDRGIVDK